MDPLNTGTSKCSSDTLSGVIGADILYGDFHAKVTSK